MARRRLLATGCQPADVVVPASVVGVAVVAGPATVVAGPAIVVDAPTTTLTGVDPVVTSVEDVRPGMVVVVAVVSVLFVSAGAASVEIGRAHV